MSRPPNAHTAMTPILERLRKEPAQKRVHLALSVTTQLQEVQGDISDIRRGAVRELRAQGWKLHEIAKELGVTISRVKQIEEGSTRAEREGRLAEASA